ncbi:MAG: thiopurine S-methyltransferase [Verrucomicrobiota bacterium]
MDAEFWHEKWRKGDIGFHEAEGSLYLKKYFGLLGLERDARVFLPLCGKTRDVGWLMEQGYRVVGAELSEVAVRELFEGLALTEGYEVSSLGAMKQYSGEKVEVFVGNVFDLTKDMLGEVDAVFDRAALVALPAEARLSYAAFLGNMVDGCPRLLVTLEYDQDSMQGPPHSVDGDEVRRLFGERYDLEKLDSREELIKGRIEGLETAWILR